MKPLLLLLLLTACNRPSEPLHEVKTDNRTVDVQHLFTIDGCKVYSFTLQDEIGSGTPHFIATCPNATTLQQVRCGKTCTREEAIRTLPGMTDDH